MTLSKLEQDYKISYFLPIKCSGKDNNSSLVGLKCFSLFWYMLYPNLSYIKHSKKKNPTKQNKQKKNPQNQPKPLKQWRCIFEIVKTRCSKSVKIQRLILLFQSKNKEKINKIGTIWEIIRPYFNCIIWQKTTPPADISRIIFYLLSFRRHFSVVLLHMAKVKHGLCYQQGHTQ